MKTAKNDQIRVRLPLQQRAALEDYVRKCGSDATVSSIIREYIQAMIDPSSERHHLTISHSASLALKELSVAWGRSEQATIDQCILEMHSLMQRNQDGASLLMKEIRLRESYRKDKSSPLSADRKVEPSVAVIS